MNRIHFLTFLFFMNFSCKIKSLMLNRQNFHSSRITLSQNTVDDFIATSNRPFYVAAPMVDHSELAFRLLVRQYGVDLTYTQMHHARNFVNDPKYRRNSIDWLDYTHVDGIEASRISSSTDRPLIVQFAGDDPNILVKAAQFVENHNITSVDLNLGCPQKIAKRGNYGAYLLENTNLVKTLLTSLVNNLKCPVTCKIRILENDADTLDLCQMIESTGIKMLTVHGRTVHQNKLYTGEVNWPIISQIKKKLSIPIIANGGISCYYDVQRCIEMTGADGVMSSEGLLENPKLFDKYGDEEFRNNYISAQFRTVDEYLGIIDSHPPPADIHMTVRSHLFPMLFRFLNAPPHADLRQRLAMGTYPEMREVVSELKDRLSVVGYDTNKAVERGLLSKTNWYMRHRDETAESRILSRRRDKPAALLMTSTSDVDSGVSLTKSSEDVQKRLSELKERLLRNRRLSTQ